jgi:hypothetical protein
MPIRSRPNGHYLAVRHFGAATTTSGEYREEPCSGSGGAHRRRGEDPGLLSCRGTRRCGCNGRRLASDPTAAGEMGRPVSSVTIAALIAAGSGLMGGLLAATATRSTERFRVSAALLEKAEERRLSSIEAFLLATTAWLDWLEYIEDLGWKDIPGKDIELNRRVKARDEAYRRLLLLASEQLRHWLVEVYTPVEFEVRRGPTPTNYAWSDTLMTPLKQPIANMKSSSATSSLRSPEWRFRGCVIRGNCAFIPANLSDFAGVRIAQCALIGITCMSAHSIGQLLVHARWVAR